MTILKRFLTQLEFVDLAASNFKHVDVIYKIF